MDSKKRRVLQLLLNTLNSAPKPLKIPSDVGSKKSEALQKKRAEEKLWSRDSWITRSGSLKDLDS